MNRYLRFSDRLLSLAMILTCLLFTLVIAAAQESQKRTENSKPDSKVEQSKQAADKSKEKPGFALSVKSNPILNISLKAEKVKLVEIAAELSKRLKTPVVVGASLQSEVVSIEFSGLTLEPAMQLLAPAVYVDYEIETSGNAQPKPLGIYFWDANSGEPSIASSIQSSTQSMLIEGDTEDGVEPQTDAEKKKLEEQPLRIQFQENKLSVKARKQPLVLVLLKIGEELGIPVDIQFETEDTVDIEFSKLSVEDALRKLSPNIKLFLRADLSHAERRVLRIVFTDPSKTTSTGI